MKPLDLVIRRAVLAVLVNLIVAAAAMTAGAQTTIFTYQGRLTDNNVPANTTYEMQFKLFDAATAGLQLPQPTPVTLTFTVAGNNAISVFNGAFTVPLDFGGGVFIGADRWLEISVRKPSDPPGFTPLTPRQQITSSPYAIKSQNAAAADALSPACNLCVTNAQIFGVDGSKVNGAVASATTAGSATTAATANNALNLGGVPASGYLPTAGGTITGNLTVNGTLNGNGSGVTNVPGTFKWNVIAGTTQQAVGNNGYVANNAAQVTITLPTAPNVGDTIRIAVPGSGVLIAQNAGQQVLTPTLSPTNITGDKAWVASASSSDGTKLVAVAQSGQIYTSTDSGVTWTPRDSNRTWESVASSSDGTKLVAVVQNGQIYTSTDSGVTWTPHDSNRNWVSVASSADGAKLVALVSQGQIYTSTDSGVTWTPRDSSRVWQSVASSADGAKLVAAERVDSSFFNGGFLYTSTDSGVTWFPRDSKRFWSSVASSSDGTKLVAVAESGQIYTSTDSGVTWTPRDSNRTWESVASSSDGTKLVAVVQGGQIYTSTDSGATWTPRDSNRNWESIASSSDGTKLVAPVVNGQIYTSTDSGVTWTVVGGARGTTTGTAGNMIGQQLSAVELIYIGSGQFLVLSSAGQFTVN